MKKILRRVLLVTLVFGVTLVGCGKEKENKDQNKESTAPTETVLETKTEAPTEKTEPAEPVYVSWTGWTTTDVNFRTEPNTNCEILEVLPTGQEVTVLAEENGFYHVDCRGKTGWLSMDYVEHREENGPSEASSEEETTKEEPTTRKSSGENGGILTDNGLFPDVSSLPNNSIPYGNDWEDKDANGLPNGIYYYEALYSKYYPLYRIKTDQKLIYLTFDEGYEAGYTPIILDTLKEKNVKAVFFITKQFFDSDTDLIQRMIDEGHILGNHTCLHPSGGFPKYVDNNGMQSFIDDVQKLHSLVYDKFGYEMQLFRFPEGESSEMLMAELDNLGYTSVFWSYAHRDYVTDDQPPVEKTLERCLSHMAPGSVYLLHAVSSSNTEALGDFIDGARAQGFDFAPIPVDEVSKR